MDSIGDFIYLVLMIGAVIVGLLRKNKQTTPPPTATPKRDFKDLFPEMPNWMEDDEEEERNVPSKPIEAPQLVRPTLETPAPPVFTYDAPSMAVPGRLIVKPNPVVVNPIPVVMDEPHLFDDEPFDIRQAVLYSEILKRPSW